MSDEKYNILLAIEDGLIHPFVSYARDNGDSEEDITEAAKMGIGNNMKVYAKLIIKAEQTLKKYRQKGDKTEELSQSDKIVEYNDWLNEAKRALGILNGGDEIKYKNEMINPL